MTGHQKQIAQRRFLLIIARLGLMRIGSNWQFTLKVLPKARETKPQKMVAPSLSIN
jgi:hypothetical protein